MLYPGIENAKKLVNYEEVNAVKEQIAKMPREEVETMAEIEKETKAALEMANDILNNCLRTICFGDVDENNKVQPECLIDAQKYNRELAQKVADKAIKIRNTLIIAE